MEETGGRAEAGAGAGEERSRYISVGRRQMNEGGWRRAGLGGRGVCVERVGAKEQEKQGE